MPDAPRRKRPLPRHADVYTEADGLFGRLADFVIENPVRSGGIVTMVLVSSVIVTNAAYFQTARHPDPFFSTRPGAVSVEEPARTPSTPSQSSAPASQTAPEPATQAVQAMPAALPPAVQPDEAAQQSVGGGAMPMPTARPRTHGVPTAATKTAAPARAVSDGAPSAPSDLIAATQRALVDSHFYGGPVDGILGPQTRTAISNFEMKIGLIPTGQPSSQLLQQIRKGYPAAAAPESTGSVIDPKLKRVQHALNEIGYGPLPEDGITGDKTSAAIKRFQIDNRLPPTGRLDGALTAKLTMIGAMGPI